jgi:transcriptional regulator with XRE-family HTH domain
MTTGERIKALRMQLNLTQEMFAKAIGLRSSQIIKYYESGARQPSVFTAKYIIQFAAKNGIELDMNDIFPQG